MAKLTTKELLAAKPSVDEFRSLPRFPIYTVANDVRSLENVGQLFRLSDAGRVAGLYLCGITGYPPLPDDDPRPGYVAERAGRVIAKTAIHTIEYVPWQHRDSALGLVRELKKAGVQIIALEQTDQSVDYTLAPFRFPVCVVLGHERSGVYEDILSEADLIVSIPMFGMGNSLNVAMSYAIVLYELVNRYLRTLDPKASDKSSSLER